MKWIVTYMMQLFAIPFLFFLGTKDQKIEYIFGSYGQSFDQISYVNIDYKNGRFTKCLDSTRRLCPLTCSLRPISDKSNN